jgi:hypothetical protein
MSTCLTTISGNMSHHLHFVGDTSIFKGCELSGWQGDEVYAESMSKKGKIIFAFEDENDYKLINRFGLGLFA